MMQGPSKSVTDIKQFYTQKSSERKRKYWSRRVRVPSLVSAWKTKHAEGLHVKYDTEFLKVEEVLLKAGIKSDLTEDQHVYLHQIQNYLKGFTSSIHNFDFFGSQEEDKIMGLLANMKGGQDLKDLKGHEVIVQSKVRDFIDSLLTLLKKIQDRRRHYRNYKGNYKKLVCVFAEMCLQKVQVCDTADQSFWRNLKGRNIVTSTPDCRFYKYGFSDLHSENMFSVIQVKKDLDSDSDSDLESPHTEQTNSWKSVSSDESSSCSSSKSKRIKTCRLDSDDSDEGTHTIKNYFNDRILGQHAGELLLDLHYYGKKKEETSGMDTDLTMPGMIVDGSLVYITMLRMSRSHYHKLKENKDLDKEDNALIYYSSSYDILEERQRNMLMKVFMSFNNVTD